jgi:hypothetical protein
MKSRHAAALALVGWFMMMAESPFNPSPFALETIRKHPPPIFKTESECEIAKQRFLLRHKQVPDGYLLMCIATDDPRLKEK